MKRGTEADDSYSITVYTPEELTALRRKERKAAKIARARLAVRAGQQLADGITALGGTLTEEEERELEILAEREMAQEDDAAGGEESGYGKHIPGLIYLKPQEGLAKTVTPEAPMVSEAGMPGALQDAEDEEAPIEVEDMESLQLSPFEVLFLSAMLGVLEVRDSEVSRSAVSHPPAYMLIRLHYRTSLSLSNPSTLSS